MITEDRTREVAFRRIREVARRLFEEQGVAGTSIADVAAAAGVDTKTVQRYFPTKAAMLWRGYDETYEVLAGTLREYRHSGRVADGVRAALRNVLRYAAAENDEIAAEFETIDRDPRLFAELEDRIATHKGAIIAFVAAEIGQEVDDLAPRLVGETVSVAALITTRHWASVGDPQTSLGEAVDAAVAPVLEAYAGLIEVPAR